MQVTPALNVVMAPDVVDDDDDNTRENFWCHGEIIVAL